MIPAGDIAGLVLAGGRSRRFGWEKAAVVVDGRPLLDIALSGLAGCGALAVNAPNDSEAARLAVARGLPLLPDAEGLPDGPLTGVLAGLDWAAARGAAWLATSPCDLADPPVDLVARLAAAGGSAYALAPDGRHPLSALWPVELAEPLRTILRREHPPVRAVQDDAGFRAVLFERAASFANLNTPGGLSAHVQAWGLSPDGAPFRTRSSWLQPVRADGVAAMLKLPFEAEERRGSQVLAWFDGRGAARVLRVDDEAVLVERLAGDIDLVSMAEASSAGDDNACRVLCAVVGELHAGQPASPRQVHPLRSWFAGLERQAATHALLAKAWMVADWLLAENREPRVLHGDIHHTNVLHDPARGWRAIDPKGLIGPRGYDYANLLRNPPGRRARDPARLGRLAGVICEISGLSRPEILGWTLAHAGLSAAWSLEAGDNPAHSLTVAELAASLL
ncbi:MAG: aminoglycoside phosphotransferase family protein [Caulobacter sp.]|nr:aminoglycoside phosphotransferase family protein [Caulobacter sp.]